MANGLGSISMKFDSIAPHLKDERVLIGFVFLITALLVTGVMTIFGDSAVTAYVLALVFILATIITIGSLKSLLLKRSIKLIEANSEADVSFAEELAEMSFHFENYESKTKIIKYLRKRSFGILLEADRREFVDGLQRRIDESSPPLEREPPAD